MQHVRSLNPYTPSAAAHLEAMLLDPMLSAAKRPEAEDALARLDEFKAADMDAAFAKFGVKARPRIAGSAETACDPLPLGAGDEERPVTSL